MRIRKGEEDLDTVREYIDTLKSEVDELAKKYEGDAALIPDTLDRQAISDWIVPLRISRTFTFNC